MALAAAALAVLLAAPLGSGLGAAIPPSNIDPALQQHLTGTTPLDAFVTFQSVPTPADASRLSALGLTVEKVYPAFQLAYVMGTPAQLTAAARLPGVAWLQGNDALQYHGTTGTVASRSREAWDAKSTSTTPVTLAGGVVVDGAGSTVAVVDSGVDSTHPDLAGAVVANVKYVCTTPGLVNTGTNTCFGNTVLFGTPCFAAANGWVSAADTDTSSGHGTHVAGIVAGRGDASHGRIMGNAPGASIVGVGVGEGLSILYAVEAFNWVLCNQATYGIDVVSNSWGGTGAFVVTDPVNMAVNALVAAGMTVVFSAGNDGSGSTNMVNRYAKNTTPGVIGVGSTYDNLQARSTTATVSTYSSTCLSTDASSDCPDIGAPGERISSTQGKTGPAVVALGAGDELNHLPYYSSISGTSMAAPAISGIIALLEQAKPTLSPAQVEKVLKNSAVAVTGITYPVTDADCTATGGKNVAIGCGHVDAIAALEHALVLSTSGIGSPLPALAQTPHVYVGAPGVGGADGQFAAATQWTVVAGVAVGLAERTLAGETPIGLGTGCRFLVLPGSTTVPCTGAGSKMTADSTAGTFRMDASHTFAAGTYTVEAQVLIGTSYVSFDHFQVTAQ